MNQHSSSRDFVILWQSLAGWHPTGNIKLRQYYCNLWNKLRGGVSFCAEGSEPLGFVVCELWAVQKKKRTSNVVYNLLHSEAVTFFTNDHRVVISFWQTTGDIHFWVCQGMCTYLGSLERCVFAPKCLRQCEKKSTCAPNNYAQYYSHISDQICVPSLCGALAT
jgi:hypothetical protein